MDRVKGKGTIVTGGAVGIGRSACNLLAREGAHVAVTDVLDSDGQETVRRIQQASGKAVFQDVSETFGGIDVVVNNAGISVANRPTHEITEEEWDNLMAVNVKGVFFCTKHAIPHMKKARGGSIINLSSIY